MKRIFVPLDGSDRAERVIPMARTIAGIYGARLELVHVLEDQLAYGIFQIPAELYAEDIEAYLKRLAERFGDGEAVGFRMPRGRAADIIVALTRENPDAIVVISSHGRGDLGRALIGSVADQVVRRAHCPVMVVRDEVVRDDWQLGRIMVTLDGSRLAEDALQPATALAHAAGATLDLLRVVPPYRPPAMRFGPSSTYSGSYIDPAEVARLERRSLYRGRHYLGKKFEELANEGLTVEGKVVPGTPVEQIVAAGERNGADLIVIASHGRGGLKRWMVGSIASAVLRQARVPVLIVPHPDSAETRDEQVRTAVA